MNEPVQKSVGAASRPEATITLYKIPRCPHCFERDGTITPNPKGLTHCEVCGGQQPLPTDFRSIRGVVEMQAQEQSEDNS